MVGRYWGKEFNINRLRELAHVNRDGASLKITIAAAQSADDYFKSGVNKQSRGDIQAALADYDRAISLNPKLVLAYYNRQASSNLQKTEKLAQVRQSQQKIIDVKTNYILAQNRRNITNSSS